MDSIHIKNGIRIFSNDNYAIYQMYTLDGEEYYMSLPIISSNLEIAIDFKEEYYNSLLKNEIIEEIKKRCNKLYKIKNNTIYILPNVSTYDLNNALEDNDNHAYEYIFMRLQKYVSNSYYMIKNDKININQVVNIVIETENDKKFMHWLDIQNKGFFKELNMNKISLIDNDTGSSSTKSGVDSTSINITNTLNKPKTKVLIPKNNKHGFSHIYFIIIILLLAIIGGICLANIIYFKKIIL